MRLYRLDNAKTEAWLRSKPRGTLFWVCCPSMPPDLWVVLDDGGHAQVFDGRFLEVDVCDLYADGIEVEDCRADELWMSEEAVYAITKAEQARLNALLHMRCVDALQRITAEVDAAHRALTEDMG